MQHVWLCIIIIGLMVLTGALAAALKMVLI
jgi:hypothetical protein